MIGKYEREKAVPSIEAAKKIAEAFEVSLDYLAGEGINDQFDKKTIQHMRDIEDLNPAIKSPQGLSIEAPAFIHTPYKLRC